MSKKKADAPLWPHPTLAEAYANASALDEAVNEKLRGARKALDEAINDQHMLSSKLEHLMRMSIMQRDNAESALAAHLARTPSAESSTPPSSSDEQGKVGKGVTP